MPVTCSENVDVSQLEQLRCFQTGCIRYPEAAESNKKRSFVNTSAFLPCQVDHEHYQIHDNNAGTTCHQKALDANEIRTLMDKHGSANQVKQIDYDKPVAVIYNPASGNGRNSNNKDHILSFLSDHDISAVVWETQHRLHAWELVESILDLKQYSAIVAVGGDGTLHEVVNGLMNRNDTREKIPVAFLPNGTGNDTLMNFGVASLDQALNFIAKGQVIQMDCNLVTFDADDPESVPEGSKRDRVRYSIANSAAGFIAEVAHKASTLKRYIGGLAYPITGVKELLIHTEQVPVFDVHLEQPDGSSNVISNLQTNLLFINNGKFAGGHTSYSPGAMLNDGLLDVIYKEGSLPLFEALTILNLTSTGAHVYREDINYIRAKSITIKAVQNDEKSQRVVSSETSTGAPDVAFHHQQKQQIMYQIDGESFSFSDYVRIEAIPEALEVIVDYQSIMSQSGIIKMQRK